jgi:hypothetical protein
MEQELKEALNRYIDHLKEKYAETGYELARFNIITEDLPKFIRLKAMNGAHSYICKVEHEMTDKAGNKKKFAVGDILPAADNFTPFYRLTVGNVIRDDYKDISWSKIPIRKRK